MRWPDLRQHGVVKVFVQLAVPGRRWRSVCVSDCFEVDDAGNLRQIDAPGPLPSQRGSALPDERAGPGGKALIHALDDMLLVSGANLQPNGLPAYTRWGRFGQT